MKTEAILNFLTSPLLLIIISLIAIFAISLAVYKKAPPNTAMVVTGLTGNKTIIGRGCFVIPIIQRVDYMYLRNIQSDFTSKDEIPTKDAINILVDAVANVSISQDPEKLKIAASKFLGYSSEQIKEIITPVFEGNIREIISQVTLKELIQGDKKEFAERVIANVTPNLSDMGLDLTTFNIQNFKDKNGIIDNLGLENVEQIKKDASVSKAKAKQEIAIAESEAIRVSNEARIKTESDIAIKQNKLDIQKAELKKEADIKQAEADIAYQIQQEQQRKILEITTANASLAKQEKEIELKEREVSIKEKILEAEIKKQAEAEKYAKQQEADAKLYWTQKQSEAELFERSKRAEAAQIEAQRRSEASKLESIAKKIAMENEADGIKAKGKAEAAAIQAKALAEAEGIMKKAQAMKEYQDAAMTEMTLSALKTYFEQLPAIAEAAGKAYTNVDKIVMFGGESSKLTEDIIKNVTQISEGLGQSLGIDLKSLLTGVLGTKLLNNNKEISINIEKSNEEEL